MSETELPGPPPISGGLVGAADIMPPLDLPVIPQVTFESPLPEMPMAMPEMPMAMPELNAPMPVMSAPEPTPVTMPPVTMPVAAMPVVPSQPLAAPMMMSPLDMEDDNLLELPDMVAEPMDAAPALQLAAMPVMTGAGLDMGVLSTLGATPEPPAMPAVAQPAFPQSVDMGIGKIDLNAAMDTAPVNFAEDVKVGAVMPQANTENVQLSEAMIEEIVKRVVERLSTKAVQEIAWEVVPEMAELMIRKQISQHQQLSH